MSHEKSLNIFNNLFRGIVELPRVFDDVFQHTERGGIVVAVADAFVEDEGEVEIAFLFDDALCVEFVGTALGAEREENGTGTEIVPRACRSEGTRT